MSPGLVPTAPGEMGQQVVGRARRTEALLFDPRPHRLLPAWALARVGLARRPPRWSPLGLREVEVPAPPSADWLTLAPRFVGICGSDVMQARLSADADNPLSAVVSFPHVMGHEIVARVVEDSRPSGRSLERGAWVAVDPWLGCRVRGGLCCSSCEQGLQALCERVTEPVLPGVSGPGMHLGNVRGLPGGFSRVMLAHSSQCKPLPAGLDPAAAVLADPLAVALHAVRRAEFPGDGSVLVLGAGTIGLCVTALLKLRHPEVPVLVSAAWPHLAEAVRALGAEPVSTVSSSIVRHVGERTGGRQAKPWLGGPWLIEGGAALVVDGVGSAATAETALRAVRRRGRVVRVGVGPAGRLQSTLAYYKEVSVLGSNGYAGGELEQALALLAEEAVPYERWLTHTFPLSQWREGFRAAARPGSSQAIKVMLEPAEA